MVNRQLLDYQCRDGVTNKLDLHLPIAIDSLKPVILVVPALGVRASKYESLLQSLAAIGFTASSMDLRGNGHSSVRASRTQDFGYADLVEQEFPAALDALERATGSRNIVLLGHSLGGQVSCLYASQGDTRIQRIVLTASCSVYYRGWSGMQALQILALTQLANVISQIVGYFPGRKLGFGEREARTLINDWAQNARTGRYQLQGSSQNFATLMQTIRLPITALNYEHDNFAPTAATEHLLKMMPNAKITKKLVSAAELSLTKADHFNWMKSPDAIAKLVLESLDASS